MEKHRNVRSVNGTVVDVIDGDITCCVHPDLAAEFTAYPLDTEVERGWIDNGDGTFTAPPEPEAPEAPAPGPHVLTEAEFWSRLTRAERTAIKDDTSAISVDFRDMLALTGKVDIGHADTIEALEHWEATGILTAERVTEITA